MGKEPSEKRSNVERRRASEPDRAELTHKIEEREERNLSVTGEREREIERG